MKKSRTLVGLCMVGALAVAACGSDERSSSTDATTGTTGTTAVTASTAASADTSAASAATSPSASDTPESSAPSTDASESAGPIAADPSLSPVTVGFHSLEGGAVSFPELRQGFESGMNYVNEELGGINGHPMKAELCKTDVTPESSVNCANSFVENGVVMAVQGLDIAADAALPILQQAGIVEFGFYSPTPAMNNAVGDAYFSLFSNEEGVAADLVTMSDLGVEKEAIVIGDVPARHALYDDVFVPTAERLGIELTPFFYPTQADWATIAATVLASSPDGIFLLADDATCLAAVPALRAAGFTGVIHASSCSQIITDLAPEDLENVINNNEFYYPGFTGTTPPKPAADIAIYERFIKRDFPDAKSVSYTMLGFHTAVQAADMLRQVPGDSYTAETVKAAMGSTTGPQFFRDTQYDCSKPSWPGTTACGSGAIFTRVTPDRKKEVLPNQPVDISSVTPTG